MGRNQHGKGIGAPRGEGATQREERFKTRRTSSRPRAERLGRRRLDALRALPDYLAPGLDIVFVGINPGERSARIGHYYGNPRNPFWRLLHEAGLTPRRLRPEEDHLLPAFGIGITDIVKRPSRGVGDLAGTEFRRGRAALEAKLLRVRPRIVCFNSKTGFVHFFGPRAFRRFGRQAVRIGPSRVFVMPSTSPANAAVPLAAKRRHFVTLRRWRDTLRRHQVVGAGRPTAA